MKNQKPQVSTSIKSKNRFDFGMYIILSGVILMIVYITTPEVPSIFTIVAFVALIVPTLIALVSGAPFVPTPMKAVKRLLKLADIKKGDTVVDIGCGDGRMCHLANKLYGANAIGYELSPLVFFLAKIRSFFWKSKAKIHFADFRKQDISNADFIVTYMLPETLLKFIPKFENDLKPGAKILSYAFNVGDWNPIHIEPSSPSENISKVWIYEIGKQYTK